MMKLIKKLFNIKNTENTVKNEYYVEPIIDNFANDYEYLDSPTTLIKTQKLKQCYLTNIEKEQYCSKLIKKIDSVQKRLNSFLCSPEYKFITSNRSADYKNDYYYRVTKNMENYLDSRKRYLNKEYRICQSGIEGELVVNNELKFNSNLRKLSNIRLEFKDRNQVYSFENDMIILSRKGIFLIEIKNYHFDVLIDSSGRWMKKMKYSSELMFNVATQNNRHVGLLDSFLKKHTNIDVESKSVIVVANYDYNVLNMSNQVVLRPSDVYMHIMNYPDIYTDKQLDELENILSENALPLKEYAIFDYEREINFNMKYFINKIIEMDYRIYRKMSEV